MKKIIKIVIVIIILVFIYWAYRSTIKDEELSGKEQACIDSGGMVSMSSCCKTINDFPNLCLINHCNCSLESSHEIKICDCGFEKCFNGTKCIFSDDTSIFLEELRREIQVNCSEIEIFGLKWISETGLETTLYGKGFKVSKMPEEKFNDVISFLINSGFKADINNIADNPSSTQFLRGYIRDKDVCVVIEALTKKREAGLSKRFVLIRCGRLE